MSKYVKDLLIDHLKKEIGETADVVVVSIAGLTSNKGMDLRKRLRAKNIHLRVVRNSLARLAVKGSDLTPALKDLSGPAALAWGGEDIVALAKEISALAEDKAFAPFKARCAAIGGELFSAEQVVKEVSKWPSRRDVLATISGQLLGTAAKLSGQLVGAGGKVAGQILKKSEGEEAAEGAAPAADAPPAA